MFQLRKLVKSLAIKSPSESTRNKWPHILFPNGRTEPNKLACWFSALSEVGFRANPFLASSLACRRSFLGSTCFPLNVATVDLPKAALVWPRPIIAFFLAAGMFFFHPHFLKWYLYWDSLVGKCR